MEEEPTAKRFDVEERTFRFAQRVRLWVKGLPVM